MNMISQRKKKMQAFRNRDEQKSNIIDLESHTTRVLFSSLCQLLYIDWENWERRYSKVQRGKKREGSDAV